MEGVDTPLRRNFEDNDKILRLLNEQGLETIKFDDVKYTHEQIGEGFWGEVFKIQSGDNVMVIKTSKRSTWQGDKYSLNEVEIMRTLDHRNIVKFLGVCVTDRNQLYPLLEYIDGGTLEDFLQNDSIQIPWISRFGIAADVANGMKYLHFHNIMHRDLTSTNILLRIKKIAANDEVQVEALISDFGLAKAMQKERALSQVGTVDWMAPEVIRGEEYNKKADIFSYGIILCEMIGRCEADPDTSVIRTMSFEVDFDDFVQKSCEGCPPQFLDLAKSCCKLDPEHRPTFEQVYNICVDLIQNICNCDWDNLNSSKSLEKLNLSGSSTPECNLNNSVTEHKHMGLLNNEPRFSVVVDDIKMLEEDTVSLRSFKSNSLRLKDEDPGRRASIINPIPSVNRNNGRIVLTILNDASPLDATRSPSSEPPLSLLQELARVNERDELRALDELSVHSTLVLFDPGQTVTKRRASAGKQNQHKCTTPAEVPFGRRQFSKKKKIRPAWKSVFNKSKSPKQEPSQTHAPKETGLISFFKNLGGSKKHNLDSNSSKSKEYLHSSIPTSKSRDNLNSVSNEKSKISKSRITDDKESGKVTMFAAPPASPKHVVKHHQNHELTPTNETSEGDPFASMMDLAVCQCGECRECQFLRSGVPRPGAAVVARNESYRMMKPLRTQSVPVEYEVAQVAEGMSGKMLGRGNSSNRASRSRSFRDKLGFLPDKTKNSK